MKLNNPLIVIDMEFNAQEEPHIVWEDQIIEIGAVYINRFLDMSTIQTFHRVIKHPQALTPFITKLTGITQEEVDTQGMPLEQAFKEFAQWVETFHKRTVLVGWGSDAWEISKQMFDKGLPLKLKCWNGKIIMDWETAMYEKNNGGKNGLKALMGAWKVEWDHTYGAQHRALADSFNTLRLLMEPGRLHNERKNLFIKEATSLGAKLKILP